MSAFFSAIILAIVQGLTEWLPVSSSGHLVLFHEIMRYEPNLLFDVTLHFGTLLAVFVYFGKDIMEITEAILKGKFKSEKGRLGLLIITASIPAGVIGILFRDFFESAFSSLYVVAFGFGITGILLIITSLDFKRSVKDIPGYFDAFLIGAAQAFAILPGVSRSGSTISVGILRGLNTKDAMRFSFLMSIPVIFGAGIAEIGNNRLPSEMIWATLVSFLVGLATIHFLLKFVSKSKKNLRWFALYLILLALGIFYYLLMY